ncbi:MAG TPA: hypothetical protein VNB22_20365 [Pyrinomonadaceae bacterium]|nr:hypothetical protein [Pyrinomonadaceae bacterium]
MSLATKIALLSSGLFLLSGMLTGVWKYAKIMSSIEHKAPAYVDIAHRASFFYSFASLVIAKLIEFSPFSQTWQTMIVAVPLLYFVLTVIGYIKEGLLDRTENMFAERNFVTVWFMYGLIAGEIGGFLLILGGFIYTQFFI